MSSKSRNLTASTVPVRPGEGASVPIRLGKALSPTGESAESLELNMREAPVPDRKYVADVTGLIVSKGVCKLLFAQERVSGEQLRSLLVVHVTDRTLRNFQDSAAAMTKPTYREIAAAVPIQSERPTKIVDEPDQTVALQANLILSAMSGSEAALDFYQLSPFNFLAVRDRPSVPLDAVVRVDLRSSLLLGLLDAIEALNLAPAAI